MYNVIDAQNYAIIKALANKFAEPYYHIFAWLVA